MVQPSRLHLQAATEVETLGARLRQEFPDSNEKRSFALLPTVIPARRASRLDPLAALHYE